jgi:hypothetical protein
MSERTARPRAATREVWLDRIARYPLSGLTPAQFCAIEAVSQPSFYARKHRLAAEIPGPGTGPERGVDCGPHLLLVRLATLGDTTELGLPGVAVLRLSVS